MGCSFSSCVSSSSVSNNKSSIRVVHLTGYREDFDHPVTVCEVIGNSQKHFVCNHLQLLSAFPKPLMPDTLLKPGEIYFLLPLSVFQSSVSPQEFAPIVKKLVNFAKSKRSNSKAESGNTSSSSFRLDGRSSSWRSPVSSPGRLPEVKNISEEEPEIDLAGLMRKSTKSRSWKPILSTIRERSFNRRSESDLQEKSKEVVK